MPQENCEGLAQAHSWYIIQINITFRKYRMPCVQACDLMGNIIFYSIHNLHDPNIPRKNCYLTGWFISNQIQRKQLFKGNTICFTLNKQIKIHQKRIIYSPYVRKLLIDMVKYIYFLLTNWKKCASLDTNFMNVTVSAQTLLVCPTPPMLLPYPGVSCSC